MFKFNSISIRKYSISCGWYNFFRANVSGFTHILLVKIKNFEISYVHKKSSYANTFR